MSNLLEDYLADQTAPDALKDRVMASARLLILAKDLGELFSFGLIETGQEGSNHFDDSTVSKNNKPKNKNNE